MIRALLVSASTSVLLAGFSGCNTEPMWGENQAPQGPVTNLASPEGVDLPDLRIIAAKEVDLVEEVLTHRALYGRSLVLLRDYYRAQGYNDKLRWAEAELAGLERIKPYKYILSAEVPSAALHPTDSIAEADLLYQRGQDLLKRGGHEVPGLYRQDVMRQALQVFTDLVTKYPSSDKIDDAAFFCGEILKEYFQDQEPIAVQWYERAYTWDPHTPHPARFQCAVVYDYRMHNRARALELYHAVLLDERHNQSNLAFASQRIHDLTGAVEPSSVPPTPQAAPKSEREADQVIELGPDDA